MAEQQLTLAGADTEQGLKAIRSIQLHPLIRTETPTTAQRVTLHRTIHKVTRDLEHMAFNTAISAMMIFVNEAMTWPVRERSLLRTFLILLNPFAPHLAEELWEKMGETSSLSYTPWPQADPSLLEEETLEIVLQVNGKLRDKIRVAKDLSKEQLETLASQSAKIQETIQGKPLRKTIVVPGKLVNFVVGS